MKNLLANIANAGVRGTLHAPNSVLFAKYLSLAWGFSSATAASLSGVVAGVWLMPGKIFVFCRSAWQLHTASLGFDENPDKVKDH